MPSPFPSKIETVFEPRFTIATSGLPSPLKSATAMPRGSVPTVKAGPASATVEAAYSTGNGRGFDGPPPGPGFETFTCPVVAFATSAATNAACSCTELTYVATRLLPFQRTEELELNPVPFKVSVGAALPGEELIGAKVCRYGTGTEIEPDKATICGLPAALSVTVRLPLRAPLAVGVKVTLMVHEALAFKELPQLLVCANGAPAAIEVMVRVPLPLLVRVTTCTDDVPPMGSGPNTKLVGESNAVAVVPVPVSVAGIGDTAEVNITFTVAFRTPAADGVNVTLIVQEPPATMLAQLLVSEKSVGFVP